MTNKQHLSSHIKAEALRLGFSACGIAQAEPVDSHTAEMFRAWIESHGNADMNYMSNYLDKRLDPCQLMPEAKSIVSVALNYAPALRMPEKEYQIAAYAYGKDYHDVVKKKLRQLVSAIDSPAFTTSLSTRIFVDTAPVLERYWAARAGLGWIGRNRQLIIPNAGSMFVLGELFLNVELEYDQPMEEHCGNCRRCVDACPTKALSTHPFNAAKCLSYQLIENRGELSEEARDKMGNTIYGCDRCQLVCPWNRFARPTNEPTFSPSEELMSMTQEKWNRLTPDDYRRLFKGSAVKRAKYDGLMRNIKAKGKNN